MQFRIRFKRVRLRRVRRRRVRRPASAESVALYQKHKAETAKLVALKLSHFLERYRTIHAVELKKLGKICIKNTRTRWGSCSSKGNLNFSFRLALLPAHLSDYIIVHELCHLGEFNHSQKFWDLVALEMPEYKKYRDELKSEKLR